MDKPTYKYLFGPVPSRRLGRSLGVDIIPLKTCTQNCIYCQLGKDAPQTLERREYVLISDVLEELARKIADGLTADTITISGSGEPTLHAGLGELIDGIRRLTDIPIAVITNSTLLSRADVRSDCAKADIVLPSLDAADAKTFDVMNCPHPELQFEQWVDGLCRFSAEFSGQLWLEVFFCDGVNTDDASIAKFRGLIERIAPDKVQINTSVRPTVHRTAARVSEETLNAIAGQLGDHVEVIADFSKQSIPSEHQASQQAIMDMLGRRPCSLDGICDGLGVNRNVIQKIIARLLDTKAITAEDIDGTTYFKAP